MGYLAKILLDVFVIFFVYAFFLYKKWKIKGRDKLLFHTLMYIYLSFVLYFTLMPVLASLPCALHHPYVPMSWYLFDDYRMGREDATRQIILNFIMLLPFGFLLPVVKKRSALVCLLSVFLLSLSIELIQPFFSRASDITDLVTNTAGGSLGYFLYVLLRPLVNKAG